MNRSTRTPRVLFWIILFIPLVVLLLAILTPIAVLYPVHWEQNIGSLISPFVEKKLLSWKRRSYAATSNTWQTYCTQYDEDLLYRPKDGACRFANLEFDTNVTFDSFARLDEIKQHRINILVIGDSYAMGWGVNDTDTFAYRLEQQLNVNVVNAAVSSYGTARQFQFAEKFHRREYDLIIIQYCDNDFGENFNFLANSISYPRPRTLFETMRSATPLKVPSLFSVSINSYIQLYEKFKAVLFQNKQVDTQNKPVVTVSTAHSISDPVPRPINKRNWLTHNDYLLRIVRKFRPQFVNPPILITYANSHNRQFLNFPEHQTKDNIHFLAPNLTDRDYYVLDAHMNKKGHAKLAELLAEYIALHFDLSRQVEHLASPSTD